MSVDIEAFKSSMNAGPGWETLRLSHGRLHQDGKVRAALSFRSTHRKTISAFLDALKTAYGAEAYDSARRDLKARFQLGLPLSLRRVKSIVSTAESLVSLHCRRFCRESGDYTLDQALARWFRFHPADPPLAEEEFDDLKSRLETALRDHRPPFANRQAMQAAIVQGELEPLCRFRQAMDAHLADADLETAFNQRLAHGAAAGESIPFAGTPGEFRLNDRDRRSLRRDIEARLALVSAGGTALPQVAEGAGRREMNAEEIAAWVGEIRAQALDDYIARLRLIADPLLGYRAEDLAALGLTEADAREERATLATLVFKNAATAARMLDEDAWRHLIGERKHRLEVGARVQDCLDGSRPDSLVQRVFDQCAAAAGFRVERDAAGQPGLRLVHPLEGEATRAIAEPVREALTKKMTNALMATFAFGTETAAFDADKAAEVMQAGLQDWFEALQAAAGIKDENVAAGLLCNLLERAELPKAAEIKALPGETPFRIEADELRRLVREGTPEAWKAYLNAAERQIEARYQALLPEQARSAEQFVDFRNGQMAMAVFALRLPRQEAEALYRALHDYSGAAVAACAAAEDADETEAVLQQIRLNALAALHSALGLYLGLPAERRVAAFGGAPVRGNVALSGAVEAEARAQRQRAILSAPPVLPREIEGGASPTLAQTLGKLASREAACQASPDNTARSSFVEGTAHSRIGIGETLFDAGVSSRERHRGLAAFLFGPDAPDALLLDAGTAAQKEEAWQQAMRAWYAVESRWNADQRAKTNGQAAPHGSEARQAIRDHFMNLDAAYRERQHRLRQVYLLAGLCSRALASPLLETEAALISPAFRLRTGGKEENATLDVSLHNNAAGDAIELDYAYRTALTACVGKDGASLALNPAASHGEVRAKLSITREELARAAADGDWGKVRVLGFPLPGAWPQLALRDLECDFCLECDADSWPSLAV